MGVFLAGGGLWLALLGGSCFYVVCGVVLLATAVLLWQRRREALWLYAVLVAATLVWSVGEAGFDFWALAPRGDVLLPLGLWLVLPFVSSRLLPSSRWNSAPLLAGVVVGAGVYGYALTQDPQDIAGVLPRANVQASSAPLPGDNAVVPAADWPAYGRTQAGDRYSPLAQINASNVHDLKVAWVFRTHDLKRADDPDEITDEATPIKVRDTLYLCSPHQILFAIDAATGHERWHFDPKITYNASYQHMTCRGVSYAETPVAEEQAHDVAVADECAHRIFLPTNDGRLFALNADTGALCRGFGRDGAVDLTDGMPMRTPGFYEPTSPPVITSKVAIISGAVTDNYSTHEPSGVTRGYDLYSGKLVWAFDPGNPNPNELPSATHHYVANSPNSWITSAYDARLNQIYIPTGVATPDIWGGHRTPDQERYASGILALDADTGRKVWFYQTVHHDLWDMDVPSQPALWISSRVMGP